MGIRWIFNTFLRTLRVTSVIGCHNSNGPELFENCYFLPYTGAVYPNKDTFYGPSAFLPTKVRRIVSLGKFLHVKHVRCGITIEHGPWNNYYHWLIDCIPRLWWLVHSDIAATRDIVLPLTRRLSKGERRLVECLLPGNVSIRPVNRFALVRAETFIFLPFLSGDRSGFLPPEYLAYFRRKAYSTFGIAPAAAQHKIFISRRSNSKRRFVNQDEVEKFFGDKGFICLQLEKLPIERQIEYFSNASIVVGSHGAGLTNIMFAPGSCKVIEIFHSAEYERLRHYRDLAIALGLSYSNIVLDAGDKDASVYLPLELLRDTLHNIE